MPIHHRSYAKQHHPPQLSHLSWRLLQQFLIICGFGVFLPQILLLQGCGVNTDIIPRLSVSTSEQTLAPSQTVSLIVHGDKLKNSPINFTMSCAQSLCGTLAHDQYTAPSDISVPLAVAIKAVNLKFPEQSAATTLKVYPRPTITAVTPDHIVAGTSSTLVISGLGFVPGSTISISSPGTGSDPVVTNVVIGSLEAIAVNITVPLNASGLFSVIVKSPLSSIPQARSQDIYIYPGHLADSSSLPILNVLSYQASGSAATYSCSGSKGSNQLVCDKYDTDFLPGEGIRIVGAGNNPVVPPLDAAMPTGHNNNTPGTHTYCYIGFAVDAAGGITSGSYPSCAAQEPATLSYQGTYNTLSPSYSIPLATFLWYRSEDDGPYQLFSVNGVMDVGQEAHSFGGWPVTLPSDTEDISKREDLFAKVVSVNGDCITIDKPLYVNVHGVLVDHDDSAAIQNAINAASDMGGAEIYLPSGNYNLRRPQLEGRSDGPPPYFSYTTDYDFVNAYAWSTWSFLTIPAGSRGNIHFVGNGKSTVIQLPPNSGGRASLLDGDPMPHPAYSPFKAYEMEPAGKGAETITLTSTPPLSIRPGTDIWIYGGSFYENNEPCIDTAGTAGGNCHNSELNTVVSVNGNTLQLEYPTSKTYYDDGYDSFGVVPLPTCVHNISLRHLYINAYNRVIGAGIPYGLLIDDVTVNGRVAGGVFGGGPKRDVVIENSSWQIGEGDVSWLGTAEFDQEVGVALLHNTVTGFAAVGAEGPSMNARLYFTEGTSDIYILDNNFNHISIYIQESTDDYIEGNTFHNGNIAVGYAYVPDNYPHNQGGLKNPAFLSFGPQEKAVISDNQFTLDPDFTPPWAIQVGHYQDATVENNTIGVAGRMGGGAAIMAYSGNVEGNRITIDRGISSTVGILAIPDFGPGVSFTPFAIEGNTVNMTGDSTALGIGIIGPTVPDTEQVCLKDNQVNVGKGKEVFIWNKNDIMLGCN